MNILNLLTKEKRVAGIEISDSVVRIAFLRDRKNKRRGKQLTIDTASRTTDKHANTGDQTEIILIEEPIAANIIVEGVVVDRVLLGKTLQSIWRKANLGTDYAIVAIPDDKVYSRVFSFPKSVDNARITEAMRLAIGFQIPIKAEDAYLDWERAGGTPLANEILLSAVPRTVAQGYVSALEFAGIKTLALESHLASIARAAKTEPGQTILFTKKTPDGATAFILRDGLLRFSRTLPTRFISEDKLSAEIERVRSAFESEMKASKQHASDTLVVRELLKTPARDDYAHYHPELIKQGEPASKWLVALGAAIRGKIPEGQDNLVSLLPVGTEEAYAYQKATTFVMLVRNMTVGVSIFFGVTFLFAYLFMLSLAENANKQVATLTSSTASPELIAKEEWIGHVNALTATTQEIITTTPLWSTVLNEVNARIIEGIVITNFSASNIATPMSLTGIARDRTTLNQFKKTFQESQLLSEVDIPIANVQQKSDIPFSVSFRIKDPSSMYYKNSSNPQQSSWGIRTILTPRHHTGTSCFLRCFAPKKTMSLGNVEDYFPVSLALRR